MVPVLCGCKRRTFPTSLVMSEQTSPGMKWQRTSFTSVPIILQIFVSITSCGQVLPPPKSRIMDLLTGLTRSSRDVIMGTVGRVRGILPQGDIIYPDDTVIHELFEYFKEKMRYSHPTLELPVLDPFVTDYLTADIVNDIIGNVSIYLQDVNVTKASRFEINKVKMNWLPRKLDFDIHFPDIYAQGRYNVGGMLGNIIPLSGSGTARLGISHLRCMGTAVIETRNKFVHIRAIHLNYTVERIEVNLENLMGGGRFGELVNKALSEDGPRILDLVRTELLDFGANWMCSSGNDILTKMSITLKGVVDFLKTVGTKKVKSMFSFGSYKSEL